MITKTKNYGQATLVVVIIVMVASLAVGVAASNRAISNIKRVTFTAQSDQAFHCAESGAEVALQQITSDIKGGTDPITTADVTASLTDSLGKAICSYAYSVSAFEGDSLEFPVVKQDDVQELTLDGYNGNIEFCYGNQDELDEGQTASLELIFVGDSPPYNMEKTLQNTCGGCSIAGGPPCSYNYNASGKKLVRVRPLYYDTRLIVKFFSPPSPNQGYLINSRGNAGEVERRVQVIRTNPQLPALFDFAIFSQSESKPLSK